MASHTRLDSRIHYTKSNTVIVCWEFNVGYTGRRGGEIVEDSKWSKEKVQEWFTYLDSPEGKAHTAKMCAREADNAKKEQGKDEVKEAEL